jgi:stress-induced morphogen
MTNTNNSNADGQIQQLLDVLDQYKNDHPNAQIEARRQNSVSLRIRIVDPDFMGLDRVDREPPVWNILKSLPEDVFSNITMLLLLTPAETSSSLANQEFEHPIPSRI